MNTRRITTALLVLEIALTVILLGGAISHAFDLNDLGISRPPSLDVNKITEDQGLDGEQYDDCTGDMYETYNQGLEEQETNWDSDSAVKMLEKMQKQYMTEAVCALRNFIGKFTIGAFGATFRVLGAQPECNSINSSDGAAQDQEMYSDRMRSNFIVNCTAAIGRASITNTVTSMLHTQGPGGGPAWVLDNQKFATVDPAEMAKRQMWVILVNTDICPSFREAALDALGVDQRYRDEPPPVSSLGLRVNEMAPFQLRGACTLPKDYILDDNSEEAFIKNGGWEGLGVLLDPQNTLSGFLTMAVAQAEVQKEAVTRTFEQMQANGYLPIQGECARGPDLECYQFGANKQPAGGTQDLVDSDQDAQRDALNQATGEQGLLTDIASEIRIRLLDLSNAPLPLELTLGRERDQQYFETNPTPTPEPGSDDPACGGDVPGCSCVGSNSPYQGLKLFIARAVDEAIQQHPEIFRNGTTEIVGDLRAALQAVCDSIQTPCTPHPTQDNAIVIPGGGQTVSFRIITADGFIDRTGGTALAMCDAGVQD